jgi:ribosomal protein S18 acetylase RimI-like enzyme
LVEALAVEPGVRWTPNITVERSSVTGIVIRAGASTDATALAELAARTFRETFAADNRPEDIAAHSARAYGTSQQERELADPEIATLLVEIDGQLAGYAQLRSGVPPTCVTGEEPVELWRFYVAQPWQGRGVAQALMREVERYAYLRGGRTLWLGVWERNERAKAFYHKNGFLDVGSHVFMVGTDAQTDRIFVRSLPTVISSC